MDKVKVTVILPTTGDRGPILKHSVGSIQKQTETDWELFIVGDGVTEETQTHAEALAASDERIRFFDFPKNNSRGEVNRHKLLTEEARGSIVCYLCDRDLYLSNHLEVMLKTLESCDIAMTLPIICQEDGKFQVKQGRSIAPESETETAYLSTKIGALSFTSHRMDAYLKLPFGWRETPKGTPTDQYMWHQFFDQSWVRGSFVHLPTVVYLKRGNYPGLPTNERVALSKEMSEQYCQEDGAERFYQAVFKQLLSDDVCRIAEYKAHRKASRERKKLKSRLRRFFKR